MIYISPQIHNRNLLVSNNIRKTGANDAAGGLRVAVSEPELIRKD